MTDHDLIALLRTDKRHKAFVKLYKYYKTVEKHIRANRGSRDEAADIFQEALIILYRKVNETEFVLTSSLDTYLYSVSKFLWSDALRKKSSVAALNFNDMEQRQDDLQVEEAIASENKFRLAESALAQVTAICRQLLGYFYIDKYSMQEIASKLGFSSEQSAKTQKYKCLEKAREAYVQLSSNPLTQA